MRDSQRTLLGSAILGGTLWMGAAVWIHPHPRDLLWGRLILMLAVWVLFPLGLRLIARVAELASRPLWRWLAIGQLPAALALGAAFLLPQGIAAESLAAPWLAITAVCAWLGVTAWWKRRRDAGSLVGAFASLVFIAVGGVWVALDRAGQRPLNFDPVIVLLTAIHFHYAGFLLPLFASLAAGERPGRMANAMLAGIVGGVPLVAAGITTTQLGLGSSLEIVAVVVTVISGAACGAWHVRLAGDRRYPRISRLAWGFVGVTLWGSMALAMCYGLRSLWPIAGLDIPTMRAWHGTANAIGFGWIGVVGWSCCENRLDTIGDRRS